MAFTYIPWLLHIFLAMVQIASDAWQWQLGAKLWSIVWCWCHRDWWWWWCGYPQKCKPELVILGCCWLWCCSCGVDQFRRVPDGFLFCWVLALSSFCIQVLSIWNAGSCSSPGHYRRGASMTRDHSDSRSSWRRTAWWTPRPSRWRGSQARSTRSCPLLE